MTHVRFLIKELSTPYAVLDIQFHPSDCGLFAAASSSGLIELFKVNYGSDVGIDQVDSYRVCDPEVLVLSLSWSVSPLTQESDEFALLFSLSSGAAGIAHWSNQKYQVAAIEVHSLEAWTVAWSQTSISRDGFHWYAGGDDSRLCKVKALQKGAKLGNELQDRSLRLHIVGTDRRVHGAGVTAILPLVSHALDGSGSQPLENDGEDVILTGSYDEHVRLLTLKEGAQRATVLAERHLGGGVWRLNNLVNSSVSLFRECDDSTAYRTKPTRAIHIQVLASCMHAGTRLLQIHRFETGHWSIDVKGRFSEHESMNYGSESTFLSSGGKSTAVVISTSFYDRRICVWKVPED